MVESPPTHSSLLNKELSGANSWEYSSLAGIHRSLTPLIYGWEKRMQQEYKITFVYVLMKILTMKSSSSWGAISGSTWMLYQTWSIPAILVVSFHSLNFLSQVHQQALWVQNTNREQSCVWLACHRYHIFLLLWSRNVACSISTLLILLLLGFWPQRKCTHPSTSSWMLWSVLWRIVAWLYICIPRNTDISHLWTVWKQQGSFFSCVLASVEFLSWGLSQLVSHLLWWDLVTCCCFPVWLQQSSWRLIKKTSAKLLKM